MVERTLAWLAHFRCLTVYYERSADIHQAFLSLGASLVCWSYVQRRSGLFLLLRLEVARSQAALRSAFAPQGCIKPALDLLVLAL